MRSKRAITYVGVFLIVTMLAGLTIGIVSLFSSTRESPMDSNATDLGSSTSSIPTNSGGSGDAGNPSSSDSGSGNSDSDLNIDGSGSGSDTNAPLGNSDSDSNTDDSGSDSGSGSSSDTTAPNQPVALEGPFWVDPQSAQQSWGSVDGLLTFRGSPTRSWYGTGPIPTSRPSILWTYPPAGQDSLCSLSIWNGSEVEWCGTGWTGQPAVFDYNGLTWVVFGAYDGAVHFLNAATGQPIIPAFPTDGHIKGSVTVDPDGYPLIYFGSRDNYFRVVSFDGPEPVELWRLSAFEVPERYWNDDWDSAAIVLGDYLFEGGENSNLHIVKLNRSYDAAGRAAVAPTLDYHIRGWDDQLLADLAGDTATKGQFELSIENSVAVWGNTLYFANSGGLIQGWDLTGLGSDPDWRPTRIFRYWAGDDIDATITIDFEGMLYVAVERERTGPEYAASAERTRQVGQLLKLDPSRGITGGDADPLVWSVFDLEPLATNPAHLRDDTGFWATPAITDTMVYAASNTGRLLGIDKETGMVCWESQYTQFLWSSPVVVDGILIQATGGSDPATGAQGSYLRAFDLSADNGCAPFVMTASGPPGEDASAPPELWAVPLGWRVESTPAVWNGRIYIGDRNGIFYAVG